VLSGALTDVGIGDQFMSELAEKFAPNTSALFVLVRNATPDKVVAEIASYGGTVLQSSLSHEDEAKLQAELTRGHAAAALAVAATANDVEAPRTSNSP